MEIPDSPGIQEFEFVAVKHEPDEDSEVRQVPGEQEVGYIAVNVEQPDYVSGTSADGLCVAQDADQSEGYCQNAQSTMADHLCIIEQLIHQKPFRLRTLQEKLEILKSGRPCPDLSNLKSLHKEKSQEYLRHFQSSQYAKTEWLAGSSKLNKLFCWPCVLFTKEQTTSVWASSGFDNLCSLHTSIQKHEKSVSHISALLHLRMSDLSRINPSLGAQLQANKTRHNENVKKNREVLKRFIDTACYLAVHELPFQEHSEGKGSLNKGFYRGTLNLLAEYDTTLRTHLDTSIAFRGTLTGIQNDVMRALNEVVLEKIKNEINGSKYVALLLDETSDIMNQSQLSTILRYIDCEKGEAHERFVSYSDVSPDRSVNGLFEHVKRVVSEFDLGSKLIAQTYDGATVMSGHVQGLTAKVQELYPKAIFVHRSRQNLNLILSQSVSQLKECRVFFQMLAGLRSFFHKSSRRMHRLKEFAARTVPRNTLKNWNFSFRLINTVKEHHITFIGFFLNVLEESSNWDNETLVAAQGFLTFLTGIQNCFLLVTFSRIFFYTDVLFEVLKSKNLDILYCAQKVQGTKKAVLNLREQCDLTWTMTQTLLQNFQDNPSPKRKCEDEHELADLRKALYNEIIDNVILQLEERFDSLDCLQFVSLLDPSKYKVYKTKFPVSTFEKLTDIHKHTFDFVRLKSELTVLYSFEEFNDKQPYQLVCSLRNRGLDIILPEVYKLALLTVTLPCTTVSGKSSLSALKRIKTFQKSAQCQECVSGLALLSIEKSALLQLKSTPTFYEDVITKFTRQEGRMDFMYK